VDWHALAVDPDWEALAARDLWNDHIKPLPGGFGIGEPTPPEPAAERMTRTERKSTDEKLRHAIEPIAKRLAASGPAVTTKMSDDWKKLWKDADGVGRTMDDFDHTLIRTESGKVIGSRTSPKNGKESAGGWYEHLRVLTDWIMGCHLPGAQSKSWNRKVGGLSLTRIATMRSLYQLHKAFAMRPQPHELRGAPEEGESNAGIAQSILDAMECLREQRVKQIASRIVEAALGVGIERDRVRDEPEKKWRYPKRPCGLLYHVDGQGTEHGDSRFETCHAVVIENLRNYRPDELQARRENRALMAWSAGKVRKYLEEACQLHGLHLREVMPNYTSRQDSRTGLPGMRCADVPVADFVDNRWWRKAVKRAKERKQTPTKDRPYDAHARLLVALDERWPDRNEVPESQQAAYTDRVNRAKPICLVTTGGDLFVPASPWSCEANGHRPGAFCNGKRALQADLNAAANIGLRALLDPDFPGKWWYIPCDPETKSPKADKVKGSIIEGIGPLQTPPSAPAAPKTTKTRRKASDTGHRKEVVNLWRDPHATGIQGVAGHETWHETPAYWKIVQQRVVNLLRERAGLPPPEPT
jgi:IS605 OrfB family transposase